MEENSPTNLPAGSISLDEVQRQVDLWIKTYGVRYFEVLTNMACLTEEVGELAHVVVRQYGEQSAKPTDTGSLADEMADVLWVLVALANETGVNLGDAFARNLQKKTLRDAHRHKDNPKLAG